MSECPKIPGRSTAVVPVVSLFESHSWIMNLHYRLCELIWHCSLISCQRVVELFPLIEDERIIDLLQVSCVLFYFTVNFFILNCLNSVAHDSKYRFVSLCGSKMADEAKWNFNMSFFGKINCYYIYLQVGTRIPRLVSSCFTYYQTPKDSS